MICEVCGAKCVCRKATGGRCCGCHRHKAKPGQVEAHKRAGHPLRMAARRNVEAAFTVVEMVPERIVIRDLGPWDRHPTVTNDAERVVRRLDPAPGQRVFYYDSSGDLDEIVVTAGRFAGFKVGPRPAPVPA